LACSQPVYSPTPSTSAPIDRISSIINNMWSNKSRMLEENVKPLITCNLINTDFCRGNFYDKIKSSKDLLKKALSAEKYDWANVF